MPRTERLAPAKRHPLSRLKQSALLTIKQAKATLQPVSLPMRMQLKTPYFSQWESSELVLDILEGRARAEDDPRWMESGAKSPEEYALWSWNCCGMACLKMILAARTGTIHPLVPLAKGVQKYGGYVVRGPQVDGLYYAPFCQFVQEHFRQPATSVPALTLQEILAALAAGKHVMLSVTPEIRSPEGHAHVRGGHLVVAVGYDLKKQLLYLHNPSGTFGKSQESTPVTFNQLKKFFDYKGIVVG